MRQPLPMVLVALALTSAGVAQACPDLGARISPPPGRTIASGTPIIVDGVRLDAVSARGPVLWSTEDVVPLRVVVQSGDHTVFVPERPLSVGQRYFLAFTRTQTGSGLSRAEVPIHYARWTAVAGEPRSLSGGYWIVYPRRSAPSILERVALFGVAPFFASWALTGLALAVARRRRVRR